MNNERTTTTGRVTKTRAPSRRSLRGRTPGAASTQLDNNPAEAQFEEAPPAIHNESFVIPETRAATPVDADDKLIELRAQRDLIRKAHRDAEATRLRKEIEEGRAGLENVASQALSKEIEGNNDPRIAPLRKNYPAINTLYFKQILENKFDPLNIAKLCPDIVLVRPSKHTISLGKGIEVETGEEDAAAEDIK